MKLSPKELASQLRTYHDGLEREAHKLKDEGMSLPLAFAIETVRLWKEEVRKFLEDSGARDYARAFSKVSLPQHDLLEELHQSIDAHLNKLTEIINQIAPEENNNSNQAAASDKKIFVAHGRDTTNLFELITMLESRYGLGCVAIKANPNDPRPIIERFKEAATDICFAFALMAPYDLVKIEGRSEYVQIRANVVFQLGWFYARLGPAGVCILRKKGTSIHPDLNGIPLIDFDSSVTEKAVEIEAKLKAAGLI
ncbi:nucleotide-binding protein [candidate division WOR-3 bacterium]|nr:nucleotide-binding protein [candidate division WOR-3 bacterium]